MDNEADFMQFAAKYRGKFRRIAAATQRELEPHDVEGEAWLLAKEWELKGTPARFDELSYVDKLFSHLYQKLVRYTDKKVRTGIRLDHWAHGDSPESDAHPLLNKLAAEGHGPLDALLMRETIEECMIEPGPHDTRASAYLFLLRHYNNRMRDVAAYLMISLSYCYYRFNEALEMVGRQHALPDTIVRTASGFVPRPWRSFRLTRPWVQMELELQPVTDLWGRDAGADNSAMA